MNILRWLAMRLPDRRCNGRQQRMAKAILKVGDCNGSGEKAHLRAPQASAVERLAV
jgi:hypothetical protein